MMSAWISHNKTALRPAFREKRLPQRVIGALVLALIVGLALGVVPVKAAASAVSGSLQFIQPNYRGVVAGPTGTRVQVAGGGWLAYSTVTVTITDGTGCGGVSVGSFPTDQNGQLTAGFLWPLTVNHIGIYYACGTQANNGSVLSTNTFSLLKSSPATLAFTPSSLVAGETLTLTGTNWVPGPQTVYVSVLPCDGTTICNATPVAQQTIVTKDDGTFSQQLTISAGTPTGQYYIQAANSTATLAVTPEGPLQISGQAAPVGTPVPGVNPTTTATRATQDSTGSSLSTPSPLSQASASLKNALLAAGLGLLVLLVLIGALAFFIGRSRGPDLPARSTAGKETDSAKVPPGAARQVPRRTALQPPGSPPERALTLRQSDQNPSQLADAEGLSVPAEDLPTGQDNAQDYPWDEQIPTPASEPEEQDQSKTSGSNSGRLSPTSARYVPPRRSQRRGPWEDHQ